MATVGHSVIERQDADVRRWPQMKKALTIFGKKGVTIFAQKAFPLFSSAAICVLPFPTRE